MNDTAAAAKATQSQDVGIRGIPIFRIAGIQVRLDYSWFLIFALILLTFTLGFLKQQLGDVSPVLLWGSGLLASLLFFASLLAHELSHSLVALRANIPVPAITLFLFGGVSHMGHEPRHPRTEFMVAVVGPLTSLALAVVFFGLAMVFPGGEQPSAGWAIAMLLAYVNFALAVFNMLPGYPLDGGRVLRAIVWWRTGSLQRATKAASNVGQGLAIALMILGGIEILMGAIVGGLWLVFIGLFLRGLARMGYQNVLMRHALEDARVEQVMIEEVATVPPDLPLRRFVEDHVLEHGYRGFPVEEDGRIVGLVSIDDVRKVPRESWDRVTVRERMRSVGPDAVVAPDEPLADALDKLSRSGKGRLLVMRNGTFEGMITKSGLMRFVEISQILKGS